MATIKEQRRAEFDQALETMLRGEFHDGFREGQREGTARTIAFIGEDMGKLTRAEQLRLARNLECVADYTEALAQRGVEISPFDLA